MQRAGGGGRATIEELFSDYRASTASRSRSAARPWSRRAAASSTRRVRTLRVQHSPRRDLCTDQRSRAVWRSRARHDLVRRAVRRSVRRRAGARDLRARSLARRSPASAAIAPARGRDAWSRTSAACRSPACWKSRACCRAPTPSTAAWWPTPTSRGRTSSSRSIFPTSTSAWRARCSKLGVPVVYYISPQLWAWRPGRMKTMKRLADRVLVIFPFEEEIYRARRRAGRMGRPSAVRRAAPPEPRDAVSRPPAARSGRGPSSRCCPAADQRGAGDPARAARCGAPDPRSACRRAQFVLARAPHLADELFAPLAGEPAPAARRVVDGRADDVLAAADVALVASGTVTVQAALHECPMVVVYRLSPLTYRLGRPFVQRGHVRDGEPRRRRAGRARADSGRLHARRRRATRARRPHGSCRAPSACARDCDACRPSSASRARAGAPRRPFSQLPRAMRTQRLR